MRRFFCDEPLSGKPPGHRVALSATESHHLQHVLRMRSGDELCVFDGLGHRAAACVEELARRQVTVTLLQSAYEAAPAPAARLQLAVSAPKAERLRWLVEKCVELGVAKLTLLRTERTVVDPGLGKIEKLRDLVISACKQCGRDRLLDISGPVEWSHLIARSQDPSLRNSERWLLASPAGTPIWQELSGADFQSPTTTWCLIGPEGGWTAAELEEAAAAQMTAVSLSDHILRTETAGVAVASVWSVLQTAAPTA